MTDTDELYDMTTHYCRTCGNALSGSEIDNSLCRRCSDPRQQRQSEQARRQHFTQDRRVKRPVRGSR